MKENEQILYSVDEACKKFGVPYLYPYQRLVIANILDSEEDFAPLGKNEEMCKNQIVLLPTGAGKSLCFLVPALLLKGCTLVLYPLLALMNDQKRRLDEARINSVIFRGGQSIQEREECFSSLDRGTKIILANPEVLQNTALVERLCKYKISHIAIDEAHCVSEWGESFRPAYMELESLIKKLGCTETSAFTATASPSVLQKISDILFKGETRIVRGDCDRPGIFYSVINCYQKKKMVLKLSFTEECPMLIFCGTRAASEDMARDLSLLHGKRVRFYHAGLSKEAKKDTEEWFYKSTDGILCCTCAYGMGVDKKNIRTVIHLAPSSSIEAYAQESGRAARDGMNSRAILLWSEEDKNYYKDKKGVPLPLERTLAPFAESSTCRRQVLIDALGGEPTVCSGCDVCKRGGKAPFAQDAEFLLNMIKKKPKYYTLQSLSKETCLMFNKMDAEEVKRFIWTNEDVLDIVNKLNLLGKIRILRGLWKDRLVATNVKI